jgi:hypothetical protein
MEKDIVPMPNKRKGLQLVPVVIVGSHYDLISTESQQESVARVQSLVNEMKVKYVLIYVLMYVLGYDALYIDLQTILRYLLICTHSIV